MTTSSRTFADGDRVRLHGLNKRPELNDASGKVLEFLSDAQRYRVELSSGERIRVKADNLSPVAGDEKGDRRDAQGATPTPKVIDATLYVADGRFFVPGLPAPPPVAEGTSSTDCGVEHTLRLPAGHWEARLVEQDAGRRQVSVTLVALSKKGTEGEVTLKAEHESSWSELKGITITRTVQAADKAEDIMSPALTAVVDGSILKVVVPWTKSVEVECSDDVVKLAEAEDRGSSHWETSASAAPAPDGVTLAHTKECGSSHWETSDWETSASEALTEEDAALEDWLSDDTLEIECADSAGSKKSQPTSQRRALHARRSQALKTPSGATQHRSRRLAQARRRAVSARSDGTRRVYRKARSDPLWKTDRSRAAATAGSTCAEGGL